MESSLDRTKITLRGSGIRAPSDRNFDIAVEATVEITPVDATRRATRWLQDQVGNMTMGGRPLLRVGASTIWHVPALLSSSLEGVLGQIGVVEVHAISGAILTPDTEIQDMLNNAAALKHRSPTPAA